MDLNNQGPTVIAKTNTVHKSSVIPENLTIKLHYTIAIYQNQGHFGIFVNYYSVTDCGSDKCSGHGNNEQENSVYLKLFSQKGNSV